MAQSASKPAQTPTPQQSTTPKQQPAQPKVDISTITEWAPALKHVNRLIAAQPHIEGAIRKLILEHRAHEEQWYATPFPD
jgi:hypothetical protein